MDSILVRDLRVEVLIGIHKRERHVAQIVSGDLDIGLSAGAEAAASAWRLGRERYNWDVEKEKLLGSVARAFQKGAVPA